MLVKMSGRHVTGRQEVSVPSISALVVEPGSVCTVVRIYLVVRDLRSDCLGLDEAGFCGVLVCYADTGITDGLGTVVRSWTACLLSPKSCQPVCAQQT